MESGADAHANSPQMDSRDRDCQEHRSFDTQHAPLQPPYPPPPINSAASPLRRGKWTPEEEDFANAAIRDFNAGHLDAPPGTTLRTYLSERLQCDPMRITKKFTGEASIGKKVFHPAVRDGIRNPEVLREIEDSKARLEQLYQKWKRRLVSQEQEMARKSMAAAAVSAVTSICVNSRASQQLGGAGLMPNAFGESRANVVQSAKAKSDIAKTATWLDQAETLLARKAEGNLEQEKIEQEMKELSVLIEESPAILAIAAELPKLLDDNKRDLLGDAHRLYSCPDLRTLSNSDSVEYSEKCGPTPHAGGKRKRSMSNDGLDSPNNNPMKLLASLSVQAAPVPIASSHDGNYTPSSAEDAKALVNFMHSHREQ
ncbi:hypothetical protein ACHAXT_001111 [Thalassiosira profunda]